MKSIPRDWVLIGLHMAGLVCLPVASAQPPQHGLHPPMPDQQYYVHIQIDRAAGALMVEEPVELPLPTAPAKLDQVIALPAPLSWLKLTQYLPQATLSQKVIADETSSRSPAIHVSIDGPTQSHQRWLLANDQKRNRLSSFIADWRYMSVADSKQRKELYTQFENEPTRKVKLLVSPKDGARSHSLPVEPGTTHRLGDLGCTVSIKSFYPHFAMNGETGKPTNVSEKRINPAALVGVECDGNTVERWIFAKFPDYSQNEKQKLPFKITLDSPVDKPRDIPDFVLVTIDRSKHEVWARFKGTVKSKPLAVDERIAIGDTQYTFRIAQFVASGLLIEDYEPATGRGGVPALQFTTTDASGKESSQWLPVGGQNVVKTTLGPMKITFGPRKAVVTHGETP